MTSIAIPPAALPSETACHRTVEPSLKRRLCISATVSEQDATSSDIHIAKKPKSESEDGTMVDRATLHRAMQSVSSHLKCPITQALLVEPVVAGDGFLYERAAISEWLKRSRTSPVTRAMMFKTLSSECVGVRNTISDIVESGVLEPDICIEWHMSKGKLTRDDACAKRHFESAVELGCSQAPKVLEMLSRGIELRMQEAALRHQATEADVEADWIERVISATDIGRSTDNTMVNRAHYSNDEDGDYSGRLLTAEAFQMNMRAREHLRGRVRVGHRH